MEKLIELLNEYEKVREKSEYQKLSNKEYKWFSSYFFPLCFWHQENFSWAMTNEFGEWTENVICSKKFWFIKWLVDNDKIDSEKISEDCYITVDWNIYELIAWYHYNLYQTTIMLLAISDTPIDDLISYLR